jgi:hypothetical protein
MQNRKNLCNQVHMTINQDELFDFCILNFVTQVSVQAFYF